jgi:hypothetical protein
MIGIWAAVVVLFFIELRIPVEILRDIAICRDGDCDGFVDEHAQIQVRHYEEEDGVIYVYILEKER